MTEWIVTSSALILIVIALRGLLKGKISLKLQYGLWALVLVRLLFPFSIVDSAISIANILSVPAVTEADNGVADYKDSIDTLRNDYIQRGETVTNQELREQALQALRDKAQIKLEQEYEQSGTQIQTPEIREEIRQQAQQQVAAISFAAMVTDALPYLWLAGVVLVGAVLIGSNLHFGWKLHRSRKELDFPDLPTKAYLTDYVATPCLFGIGKPDIYLTTEVMEDSRMRRHVLAHEMSHYRQGDHIWSVLRCVCLVLHWYNPLVWAAAILSKQDAELACDEATIRNLGEQERVAYGRTLIGMTCVRRDPRNLMLTATTMLGTKKTLKERISLIAQKPQTALYTLVACILMAAVAVGCTFTGAPAKPVDPIDSEDSVWEQLNEAVDAVNSFQSLHLSTYMIPNHPGEMNLGVVTPVEESWVFDGDIYVGQDADPYWLYYDGTFYFNKHDGTWLVDRYPDDDNYSVDVPLPSRDANTMTWSQTEDYLDVVLQSKDGVIGSHLESHLYRIDSDGKLLWYASTVQGFAADGTHTPVELYTVYIFHDTATEDIREKVETSAAEILATIGDTDSGTEPTEPITYPEFPSVDGEWRGLTEDELADFSAMFQWRADGNNWYNYALKSEYFTPVDLNLLEFFYSAPLENLTQEDLDFYGDADSQIHKYSVSVMNEVLSTYFNITFRETNGIGLDQMVHNKDASCYYHEHGDVQASHHTFFKGNVFSNGTVVLYYIDEIASVHGDVIKKVTLKHVDQGSYAPNWHIVSNVRIHQQIQAHPDTEKFQNLLTSEEGYWYWRAMGCVFDNPAEINLEYLFYNGLKSEDGDSQNSDPTGLNPFTDSEIAFLKDYALEKFGDESVWVNARKLPREAVNEVLATYFGASLETVSHPENWAYFEETDSYYCIRFDGYGVDYFEVVDVQYEENGTVWVYWVTTDWIMDTRTDPAAWLIPMEQSVMVTGLRERADGSYVVLSNLPYGDKNSVPYITNIVDRVEEENLPVGEALELFFMDAEYRYYFPGAKSQYITVYFSDGSSENIITALQTERATIADLDTYGIRYIKNPVE